MSRLPLAALLAISLSSLHTGSLSPMPVPKEDPYKPETRYRRAKASPAERLMEAKRKERTSK